MSIPNPTTRTPMDRSRVSSISRQVAAAVAIVVGGLQGVQAITGNPFGSAALVIIGGLIFYAEHNNNGNET